MRFDPWSTFTDTCYLIDIGKVLDTVSSPWEIGSGLFNLKVLSIVSSVVNLVVGDLYEEPTLSSKENACKKLMNTPISEGGGLAAARRQYGNAMVDKILRLDSDKGSASRMKLINSIVQIVLPRSMIWFYKFSLGPHDYKISDKKLQTLTEYGRGMFDLEYFKNAFSNITARGIAGPLFPDPEIVKVLGTKDIRLSSQYIQFLLLRQFCKDSSQRLLLYLNGTCYFGFLEDFDFDLDADNPWKIPYTFTFKAHPTIVFDLFSLDFSGIPQLGYILDPSSIRQTSIFNSSAFGAESTGLSLEISDIG